VVVACMYITKLTINAGCLLFMFHFLMLCVSGKIDPNYYIISALLWMRSSLESQLRNDYQDGRKSLAMLLLEVRHLVQGSPLFKKLGLLFQWAGVSSMLQQMTWTQFDGNMRPEADPWKFSFTATMVFTDGIWRMSEGLQLMTAARAWLFGLPWCVVYFTCSEGTDGDRWYVPESFDLWSSRQNHVKLLLQSAYEIPCTDDRDQRKVEYPSGIPLGPTGPPRWWGVALHGPPKGPYPRGNRVPRAFPRGPRAPRA